MSAELCSDSTIITVALASSSSIHTATPTVRADVAAMLEHLSGVATALLRANEASLNALYGDTFERRDLTVTLAQVKHVRETMTGAQIAGAVRFYAYQACEVAAWQHTPAYYRVQDALAYAMDRMARDARVDLPWGDVALPA